MAPPILYSESIELPKNERAGEAQFPLRNLPVPEQAIAVRETTDPTGSTHRSAALIHTREAPDDFPEGGYGWVVVLACSIIRYANDGILATTRTRLPVYRLLRHNSRCQVSSSEA